MSVKNNEFIIWIQLNKTKVIHILTDYFKKTVQDIIGIFSYLSILLMMIEFDACSTCWRSRKYKYAVKFLSNPFFTMLALYIGKNTVLSKQKISFKDHIGSIESLQKKPAQQLLKINELFVSNDRYLHDQSSCKP